MAALQKAADDWTLEEAAHLLNRAGFGGSPAEIWDLHRLGRHRAVARLVAPTEPLDAFPLPDWARREKAHADARERFERLREARMPTADPSDGAAERKRRELQRAMQQELRRQGVEAQGWWFDRMLRTGAPLREKMTLFWHDHFATSIQKVRQPVLMLRQNELFRLHALGSFRELTQAIVEDPAMMLYLDTQNSRKGRPNENFAREVMELFTLGEGNYREQDIREAARAFTGYTLNRLDATVRHNPRQWDPGEKTVLGETGCWTGHDVIAILFRQPAAARCVPAKLWEFFVQEKPAPRCVDALAEVFRSAGFRIGPLLHEILLSREFYAAPVIRAQIKSPVQFLVQLFKQLEIDKVPTRYALVAQTQLGQTLFMPPNVAGWDWGKAWINTNTLLARYNIAGFITKGGGDPGPTGREAMERPPAVLPGSGMPRTAARNWKGPDYARIAPPPLRADPTKLVDSLVFRFFQGPVPRKARQDFEAYAAAKQGAGITDREIGELCHLMLSTPYYQLT